MMPTFWEGCEPMSTPFLSIFSPVSSSGSTPQLSIGLTLPAIMAAISSSEKRETSCSKVFKIRRVSISEISSVSGSSTSRSRK